MTFAIHALKTFSRKTKLDPLEIYYIVRKGMEGLVENEKICRKEYDERAGEKWVYAKSGSVLLT